MFFASKVNSIMACVEKCLFNKVIIDPDASIHICEAQSPMVPSGSCLSLPVTSFCMTTFKGASGDGTMVQVYTMSNFVPQHQAT